MRPASSPATRPTRRAIGPWSAPSTTVPDRLRLELLSLPPPNFPCWLLSGADSRPMSPAKQGRGEAAHATGAVTLGEIPLRHRPTASPPKAFSCGSVAPPDCYCGCCCARYRGEPIEPARLNRSLKGL